MLNSNIVQETKEITRIRLCSGDVRTCVFLVKNGGNDEFTLIDGGFDEHNVVNQLLPCLQELGVPLSKICRLLLTHSHGDHIDGLPALIPLIPHVEIYAHESIAPRTHTLTDGMVIGDIKAVYMPGHTEDGFGFLDVRTNSLISGDGLQLWGIERFGVGADLPKEYLQTHDKLLSMDIRNIFSSHPYDFLGERALGYKNCKDYIQVSKNNYLELIAFTKKWRKENKTAREICDLFEIEHLKYPKMQVNAVEKIIRVFDLGGEV
jgi:glyoxylase-like metal-dependent hydrolase (beta-lactamase superfamily II)